jgi:hypothetical protein
MTIRILTNYPALYISDEKILVISDLHIGIEHELFQYGITIPSQAEKFREIINDLIKITKAKTLVILGDVKHKVPGVSYREMKEIPKLFETLNTKVMIHITQGNHDTYLKNLLPEKVKFYSSRGFKIRKYGFFHGHAWPSKNLMKCDHLFIGHIHPAIEFKDKFGFRSIEQVWIKGKLDELTVKKRYNIEKTGKLQTIMLPAFNKLLGGITLNTIVKNKYIGPLATNKVIDISKSKAYLLDGTFLGTIQSLTR